MSHSYRTIPDAKFEFGIISIFGDMTHKLSLSKWREQILEFVYLPPGNGFKLEKMNLFMSRDIPFNPELTPPLVNFSNFQAEEIALF